MADEVPPRQSGDPWEPPPSTSPYGAPPPPITPEEPGPPGSEAFDASPPVTDGESVGPGSEDDDRTVVARPAAEAPIGDDPPFGDEPPATEGFGAAPPPATEGFGTATDGASPVAPAKRRSKLPLIIGAAVVVLVALLGIGATAVYLSKNQAGDAKQGSCLTGDRIDQNSEESQEVKIKVVDCGSDDAKYKVVGRVNDKAEDEATNDVCMPFEGAEFIYWEGRKREKGFVLCLATIADSGTPSPN